jgi:pyroglutamyl-peptidase
MTVLLFGFEPFLEFDENPTDLIVRGLDGKKIAGERVVSRTLPVDYAKIERRIFAGIEETKPKLVLGFGLAAGRDKVTPEKVGLNYVNSTSKDNRGRKLQGVPISPRGPDAILSDLPVEKLVKELGAKGIPSALSLSAGSYLCNYAMYVCLREGRRSGFRAGFIHVPCHSEWVAKSGKQYPSLPMQTLSAAAITSVSFYVRHHSRT